MAAVHLRRIILGDDAAPQALARLRAELGASGNVVSEKGRALTRKVFGDDLSPQQVVERVCADVRKRGLAALLDYTEHFDRVRLPPDLA